MDSLEKRFNRLERPERTGYLIAGFLNKTLSIAEREELDAWVVADENNMILFEELTDDSRVDEYLRWLTTANTEQRLSEAKRGLEFMPITTREQRLGRKLWIGYAAAVIILVGVGIYLMMGRKRDPGAVLVATKPDLEPGNEKAILKLSSGKTIILEGIKDSAINAQIHISNGTVMNDENMVDTSMYEMRIPRKGFYKLVLSDGTRVWLNNESSILYPGSFALNKREVTVTGETYFEVAKDATRPFIVSVGNRKVQALGTAFNINAFDNSITLTEGIIRVTEGSRVMQMKPGEMMNEDGGITITDPANAAAWTKNQFRFKNAGVEQIMGQLERWYDCKIVYEAKPDIHLNATIDRSEPASHVLELLSGTGQVHFAIKENTITISK